LQGQQGTYNASLAPSQQFFGGASQGHAQAGQMYSQQLAQRQAESAGKLQALAGLGQIAGTYFSDPKTKTVQGEADGKKALQSLASAKVYHWTRKPEHSDPGEEGLPRVGRMATKDDVTTPRGQAIDIVSEFGKHHAAIKQLAQDVRKLTLASARSAA
jgi:hypothetical protein